MKKVVMATTGVSEVIDLNINQNAFKVTLVVIPKGNFSGTWSIEYSPDEQSWIKHEIMQNQTGQMTSDLFFNIPHIRLNVETITQGELELHVIQGA